MNISKVSMQIYLSFFTTVLLYQTNVKAAENDASDLFNRSKFIEIGAGYEYSDNIYKKASNQQSSSTVIADIEVGYKQQRASNEVEFNYYAEYKDQSKNELEESSYWIGKSKILQNVFSENLLFNFEHNRQRYLIDETKANFDENQDERDIIDLGLQWFIPYSTRTTFVLGIGHEEFLFNNSYNSDSSSNKGQVSWQYAITEITQLQLSYFGSENMFDDFDITYREHNLDARITSQYRLGNYSLNIGETWVQGSENDYNGPHYGLTVDALIRRHLLLFNASRELTNSSQQTGEDGELDFSGNPLYWYTRVSLSHQYIMIDERLTSNIRLYFNNESSGSEDKDRYGIYGQLVWSITDKLSSSISADYYESELSRGDTKQYAEAEVYGRYNINNSLYLQLTATFEKQGYVQGSPAYEEQRYTSKIAFRY